MIPSAIAAALLLAGTPPLIDSSPGSDAVLLSVLQPAAGQDALPSSGVPPLEADAPAIPNPFPDAVPSVVNGQADDATASSTSDPTQPNEIVVTRRKRNPADPLANVNFKSFEVTQAFDDRITEPLAHGYEHALPKPVRGGIHNLLRNLHEPVVFINFVLQHKIGKAAETVGRFAINTTVGVAGLVDVAKRKPFHLPRRANGFADTLGFYGVKPGPFLFVPLIGPTTVRDLAGYILDRLVLPLGPLKPASGPEWTVPAGVLHTLDRRVAFDDELARQRASADPYTAARDYYLARRAAEIAALHGKGAEPTGRANDLGAIDDDSSDGG